MLYQTTGIRNEHLSARKKFNTLKFEHDYDYFIILAYNFSQVAENVNNTEVKEHKF